jgi:pyruvate formate lyase activating enzyme
MSGRRVTVDEIVDIVEKERIFFDQSGGGVTFSGGEPLLQPEFLIALLDEFGSRSIHRTVDTTGFAKSEVLLEVAKRTDLFLYDLKIMDSARHKKWTGVENTQILKNLQLLAETGACINIRIPLIKGVNDDNKNIEQTAMFLAGLPGDKKKVNILPYHNIASSKYLKLGEKYDTLDIAEPSEREQAQVISKFADYGLEAMVGG